MMYCTLEITPWNEQLGDLLCMTRQNLPRSESNIKEIVLQRRDISGISSGKITKTLLTWSNFGFGFSRVCLIQ